MTVKIIRTRVAAQAEAQFAPTAESSQQEICATKDLLLVPCGDGGRLEILELQPVGKKPMPAGAFINGLKGRRLFLER